MKKAIKINLNGIIFHIDDDAYEKLKSYLDTIERHFSNKQESQEILNDIESRIAELFQERTSQENQVINLKIVNEVIDIMGNPKDFADAGAGEEREGTSFHETYSGGKRLYRDPDNSVIGGVCGGLSAYFSVDPVIFRLLFVIFFFAGGASILVYVILWIVLPKAETAAQKLEMEGETVNVSNLEKKIREEYEHVKENVKENVSRAKSSDTYKNVKNGTSDFFEVVGKILLVFVKIILIIIGVSLGLAGIGILFGLITLPFVGMHFAPFGPHDFSLGELLTPFTDPVSVVLLTIAICMVVLIPIAAIIYGLIKVIFNLKSHSRGLMIGGLTLWLVSLFTILGILAFESSNYSDFERQTYDQVLDIDSDTLYISMDMEKAEDMWEDQIFDFDGRWFLLEDSDEFYGNIDLDLEKAEGDQFKLEIKKEAKGRNTEQARENANNIDYGFKLRDNHLILDPVFSVDFSNKWRFPGVETVIRIPEGKVVVLDRETRDYLEGVRNLDHLSDWNMAGKTWIMTEEGLELLAN